MVIDRRQGEAGLRRRGGEAPERSGSPEALPDFIRRRKVRRKRERRRNGPGRQAVRPKAVPHTVRPHFAPKALAAVAHSTGIRAPTIRRALRASVPIPKFASLCRSLICELRNRRTLATR